jgi:hypothetical protein
MHGWLMPVIPAATSLSADSGEPLIFFNPWLYRWVNWGLRVAPNRLELPKGIWPDLMLVGCWRLAGWLTDHKTSYPWLRSLMLMGLWEAKGAGSHFALISPS